LSETHDHVPVFTNLSRRSPPFFFDKALLNFAHLPTFNRRSPG